jgi:hypothetical protein
LVNFIADVVLGNNKDLVNGVTMRFICEKALSDSLEHIAIMSRLYISLNNLPGILFSFRYSG